MSETDCITFENSGYFSQIIVDYLNHSEQLKSLYNNFPTLENFAVQIQEKNNFDPNNRNILADSLSEQYKSFSLSEIAQTNIELLKQSNTFTITTGHQLNLFSGPLYFLYKIISVINLTKELKIKYPSYNFVPIFWMATEDHDFQEINHFYIHNKKISWEKPQGGAVGEYTTKGLEQVFKVFAEEIGTSKNAQYLKEIFENAYLKHDNLAQATRFLVNELFGEYGLVIVDGNDKKLKKIFVPHLKSELLKQSSFKKVSETIANFSYPVQVKPREINLFYLDKNIRERIIKQDDTYIINNTNLKFSEQEILNLLETNPEKFSPNVIIRPLYQETILPNLCYIGGGGELAYWLELKSFFQASNIIFPILLLRNSVLLVTQKQEQKRRKLNLSWSDLFEKQNILINKKATEFSQVELDFSALKKQLNQQFESLKEAVNQTDKSFLGAVKAQEHKQIKGLENLEKRLLRANKKYFSDRLQRIIFLQNELFPNESLQERKSNFSEFYAEYGKELILKLFQEQKPLEQNFNIIVLD